MPNKLFRPVSLSIFVSFFSAFFSILIKSAALFLRFVLSHFFCIQFSGIFGLHTLATWRCSVPFFRVFGCVYFVCLYFFFLSLLNFNLDFVICDGHSGEEIAENGDKHINICSKYVGKWFEIDNQLKHALNSDDGWLLLSNFLYVPQRSSLLRL